MDYELVHTLGTLYQGKSCSGDTKEFLNLFKKMFKENDQRGFWSDVK